MDLKAIFFKMNGMLPGQKWSLPVGTDKHGNTVTEKELHILHKRGRWSILQSDQFLGEAPVLYHQCKKFSVDEPETTLHPVAFTNAVDIGADGWPFWQRAKPKWRCLNCKKSPPDSIVTTFTLLTYEETTAGVARVTQAYHDKDSLHWDCV
jgi:hypothetical protein